MRVLLYGAYVLMGVWLLISAVLRIVILLGEGLPLDPLPFVSAAIGVVALSAFAVLRPRPPEGDPARGPTDEKPTLR